MHLEFFSLWYLSTLYTWNQIIEQLSGNHFKKSAHKILKAELQFRYSIWKLNILKSLSIILIFKNKNARHWYSHDFKFPLTIHFVFKQLDYHFDPLPPDLESHFKNINEWLWHFKGAGKRVWLKKKFQNYSLRENIIHLGESRVMFMSMSNNNINNSFLYPYKVYKLSINQNSIVSFTQGL